MRYIDTLRLDKVFLFALYAAVAEVLAWVYQLRRWRREGGLKPKKPKNLPVPPTLDFAGDDNRDG
ncbi:Flagellar biosynthetic protein flhB [Providencia rustigianii]|nr:Flagellar biosynthetic protein flhB [Providencia rustigianii]